MLRLPRLNDMFFWTEGVSNLLTKLIAWFAMIVLPSRPSDQDGFVIGRRSIGPIEIRLSEKPRGGRSPQTRPSTS